MSSIQDRIEHVLATAEPEVEVLLAEVVGGKLVRLFIDHPEGVSLALCERVTQGLGEIREEYALEVSSPGVERPLSKPEHFRRYLGRRAKIRTGRPLGEGDLAQSRTPHEGRRSFTGELLSASDEAVSLAADTGVVSIAYADIRRSNLVKD